MGSLGGPRYSGFWGDCLEGLFFVRDILDEGFASVFVVVGGGAGVDPRVEEDD